VASIGHVAVGLTAARSDGREARWPSLLFWSALSLLPDIDVVGFMRGVPYGAPWGHRGATHSLALAIAGGIATGLAARVLRPRWFQRPPLQVALVATVVLASHGLLDTMTDGGLGAALLWPFSLTRFFAPWRPVPVAPIGPAFFTPDGAMIALTEVVLFLPLWLLAFRFRVRPAAIAVWLIAVWLLASDDPVRERIVGSVYPDDTHFAAGYSEDAFRAIAIGEAEDAVRGRLGEPLFESMYYLPAGAFWSAMALGDAPLPTACFGAGLKAGLVHDAHDPDICRSRGIAEGTSRAEMLRILGKPTESCLEYSESPSRGRFRMRMVCFVSGKVEMVFRRRT
jgi:inner membrane protein